MSHPFRMFIGNNFIYEMSYVAHAGQAFGELGFINKKVRAATIICSTDTVFGTLDRKGYESSILEIDKRKIKVKYHLD